LSYFTIWLLRHGQRLDFVQPQWFLSSPYPYDPPLSAYGIYQALEVVQQLSGKRICKIFTSPHLRALQTAQPIAQHLGLKLQVEFGLREWLHSEWSEDLPEITPPEKNLDLIKVDSDYRSLLHPQYPETEEELLIRADRMAEKLIIASTTNVLIVAHKHILLSIVSILSGESLPELAMAPATLISLSSKDRIKGNWKVQPPLLELSEAPDLPA
jgi:broad specificity phosphatase PhoE